MDDLAYSLTQIDNGWLDFSSSAYAISLALFSSVLKVIKSVTLGVPWVIVAVLSRNTVSSFSISERAFASLNKTPILAPLPMVAITATGVASPSEHGQDTTKMDTAQLIALSSSPVIPHHSAKVNIAIAVTTGTNTAATLSTAF